MPCKRPCPAISALARFCFVLSFFTRLRFGADAMRPAGFLADCAPWFPVAGAVVGALGGAVFFVLCQILPPLPAAFLAVGACVLVCGGLHEDGLADMADGMGGADKNARLSIMKDSRVGSFGALALILSVGLRVSLLASLSPSWGLCAMIAAHAASRAAMLAPMRFLPPATENGLGALAGRPTKKGAIVAWGVAALILFLLFPPPLAALLALAVFPAAAPVAWLARRKLGGYTGDILGASQQIGEIIMLFIIVAWIAP